MEKNDSYIIYIYVLDTLADWELGFVTSELHSRRYFKKDAPHVSLQTVSTTKDPITTMGGMTLLPDCLVEDIKTTKNSVLILPGADTWQSDKHSAILKKACEFLSIGATVCAICGATAALANLGIFDHRSHTSNGLGFLEMFSPNYKGQPFYVDQPAVADGNLITAASTSALLWAKLIIAHLGVFDENTLDAWYNFFSTGKAQYFFALMQAIQSTNNH